ncbi:MULTISPECIES: penicillin-binding protein 2 [unclassified Adlercreutzia]|uniref:penicillin-binding protein 2 n=1 Tax=unclassified Adlercreutzia TaxID=2636013 RepID=UPI0013EAFA4F|nr:MULTISPECIES: penicillin-binding protein 2 [unclassified Adlercreutzia]
MLTAIIAAVVAALVVIAVVIAVLVVRARSATPKAGSGKKVAQLDTVGVGSSPFEKQSGAKSALAGDVHVSTDTAAAKKPSDSLSSRFVGLGVLSAGIFAALATRLWGMQVMSGEQYASDAEENLYATVSTPAPRGCVYDSTGVALVTNRASQTVLADPDVIDDNDVVRRLSAVLGLPANIVRKRISDTTAGAQSQRVVADDVRLRDVAFISEHADAFPGVSVESRTVREYPFGALCAHALGYTGAPTEDLLETSIDGRTIKATDTVGLSGVEAYYDNVLSGDHGQRKVMVDAEGNVEDVVSETQPSKGSDVHLTINAAAQYVADSLLASTIAPKGDIGTGSGVAGSVVAMDVRDGSVMVMASYPTFDPANFTGGISQDIWDLYTTEESHSPLTNRSVAGQYAAASTYKAFTSMAGLHHGFATKTSTWACSGSWDGFGSGDVQKCWLLTGHGTLDLRGGIVHSCDVVFYEIAKAFYDHGPNGTGELSETALQDYLAKYNFGKTTGVDLDGELAGRIPTPAWKAEQWRNVPSEAAWRGGDYTNMIIGQGDVLVTPLQMACAYGGIATGKIMRPHLLKEVRNAQDDAVVKASAEVVSEPDVNEDHLAYVRDALRAVITDNAGSARVFNEQGLNAAGKSGTAEHTDRPDDAWFAAYAPYDDPHYVATCIIEQGGGGSDTAGPIVAAVLGALMRAEAGEAGEVKRVAGSTGKSVAVEFTGSTGRTD